MVNISKMARAAGIGSAVGATIGGIKESRDKDGDILGGIVGGAFVGSIGGAGISAGRQYLQAKRLANAAGSDIAEAAAKQTSKAQKPTQSNVINNVQDLDIAKQISKATPGNTKPITPTLNNTEAESIETALKPKKFSNFHEAQDAFEEAFWKGYNEDEFRLNQLDDYEAWYYDAYDAHKQGYVDDTFLGLPKNDYEIVPGYTTRQAYFDGLKDSIKENLRAKGVYKKQFYRT